MLINVAKFTMFSSLSVGILSTFFNKCRKKPLKTCSQLCYIFVVSLQALYASTSISTGMKGATKAMVAMNKVIY